MITLIPTIRTIVYYILFVRISRYSLFNELSLAALKVHTLEEVSSILTSSLSLYLNHFKYRLYIYIYIPIITGLSIAL